MASHPFATPSAAPASASTPRAIHSTTTPNSSSSAFTPAASSSAAAAPPSSSTPNIQTSLFQTPSARLPAVATPAAATLLPTATSALLPPAVALDRLRKRKRRVAAVAIDRPTFHIDAIDLTIDEDDDDDDDDDGGGDSTSDNSRLDRTAIAAAALPTRSVMSAYYQQQQQQQQRRRGSRLSKSLDPSEASPTDDVDTDAGGWKSASSSDAKATTTSGGGGLRCSRSVNNSTPTAATARSSAKQRSSLATPPPVYPNNNSSSTGSNRVVAKLRQLVRSCAKQHHVAAALFYADKLITLSPTNATDVLLFADACYLNREFHRAIHAIERAHLVAIDNVHAIRATTLRAFLLLGQCMLAIKQKEECLDLLGKVLPEDENAIVAFARRYERATESDEAAAEDSAANASSGLNLVSALALLMGETFEAVGNRENAATYFCIALRCDVHNSEAFFHLVDKRMLSPQDEKKLLATLNYANDDTGLLRLLYQSHIGKYDPTPSVNDKFREVDDKFGLAGNLDLSIAKAESFYYQHDIQRAHQICETVREQDPFNARVITVFVATLVELGKKRELYQYAHQLVDVYPKKASAWYTVGCYYLLVHKFEAAQRYFHKATTLEPTFAPAWIGFGNAFAAQDESDQAMSSYRTASSLFPGSHLPPLCIGMEHLRTNNVVQALEFIARAGAICPTDPLVFNELGTAYYKQRNYPMAIEMFTKALQLCKHLPERLMETWEPTLFNLGYSYRKMRKFEQAIHYFQSALRLSPRNASVLAALGFTYHMKGNLEDAIESYHAALAYNPEETLAGEMITIAFEESLASSRGPLSSLAPPPAPVQSTPMGMHSGLLGRPTDTSQCEDDAVRRTLQLDQSFSSIEPSHRSLAYSSLDFSDDSSMNLDE